MQVGTDTVTGDIVTRHDCDNDVTFVNNSEATQDGTITAISNNMKQYYCDNDAEFIRGLIVERDRTTSATEKLLAERDRDSFRIPLRYDSDEEFIRGLILEQERVTANGAKMRLRHDSCDSDTTAIDANDTSSNVEDEDTPEYLGEDSLLGHRSRFNNKLSELKSNSNGDVTSGLSDKVPVTSPQSRGKSICSVS